MLDKRMRDLPADSTIVALGNYGYDWVKGEARPPPWTLPMPWWRRAIPAPRSSSTTPPTIRISPIEEGDGTKHDVWFLDGVTAFNQIHAADAYQPAGYALWRLGTEDPSVLPLLGRRYDAPAPDSLHDHSHQRRLDFDGEGEILRVEADPTPGMRSFEIDKQTAATSSTRPISSLPTNYVIRRVGADAQEARADLR